MKLFLDFFVLLCYVSIFFTTASIMFKFLVIISSFFILIGTIISYKSIKKVITVGHIIQIAFFLWGITSAFWAITTQDVYDKSFTILSMMIITYIIYIYYYNGILRGESIKRVYNIFILGGYVICYGALAYWGPTELIIKASIGERLYNDVLNPNTLGIIAINSIILHFFYIIKLKLNSVSAIFMLPLIIIIAISGSRKVILLLAIAVMVGAFVMLKYLFTQKKVKLQQAVAVVLVLSAIIFAINNNMFSFVSTRLDGLWNIINGINEADNSVIERAWMINLGFEIFQSNPLVGIGMDNAKNFVPFGFYLHNNFVELLADLGVIGTMLFYCIYVWLLWSLYKLRNVKCVFTNITIFIIFANLFLDIARVSYDAKELYFTFVAVFLLIDSLKLYEIKKI